MPELDRRLRQAAQLRKLWRAFRDPQERREDGRLARPIIGEPSPFPHVQELLAAYGRPAVRAAIRCWWCAQEYAQIVELGERLDPRLLDDEPLIHVYLEAASARLARPRTQ